MFYFSTIVLAAFLVQGSFSQIVLPKFFTDNMVLQQEPLQATIWGKTNDNINQIQVQVACTNFPYVYNTFPKNNSFSVVLDPIEGGEVCDIILMQLGTSNELTLRNVMFGDIWICSGQSNMEWSMSNIFNASEEIAASAEYTNIRMYDIPRTNSSKPEDDLLQVQWDSWADASNSDRLGSFSAVCFLFARSISQRLGKDSKFFGLIGSNWGGTTIEPWSPPETLEKCDANSMEPHKENSTLFNAMIHPLLPMTIKGALWYQGESNANFNRDKYNCTFPEMIRDWRSRWFAKSVSDQQFPFGFVQLASNNPDTTSTAYPLLRWHQTADYGFTPNEDMMDVFMAVALDTHDEENGIHPRNKQVVGQRLATSGLNVAYGMTSYPTNGPLVTAFNDAVNPDEYLASIVYDQTFTYAPVDDSGFYQCLEASPSECEQNGAWELIDMESVVQDTPSSLIITLPGVPTGIAYLWKESPILTPLAAPIYSEDEVFVHIRFKISIYTNSLTLL